MKKTVLVLKDATIDQELLVHNLQSEYEVLEADSVEQAISFLTNYTETISAIVLNVMRNECETLQRISDTIVCHEIPIIVSTAIHDEETQIKMLATGAIALIDKLYSPVILMNTLRNSIHLQEVALREMNAIMHYMTCGISAIRVNGPHKRFIYANDRFYELVGYTKETFHRRFTNTFDLILSDDREKVQRKVTEAIQKNGNVAFEFRIQKPDSTIIHLRADLTITKFPWIEDRIELCIFTDITSEHQKERELKLLTDTIPGGIATFKFYKDGCRVLYFNDGFFKYSGYTRDEFTAIMDKDPLQVVFKEDIPNILSIAEIQGSKSDTLVNMTYRCHTKAGGFCWLSMSGTVLHRDTDSVIMNIVQYDITEQKKTEALLRQSQMEYELAMLHSGTVIFHYNIATRILTATKDAVQKYGIAEHQIDVPYATVHQKLVSSDTADAYIKFYESILRGESTGSVVYLRYLKKGNMWIESHFSTVFGDNGEPVSAIISMQDVTARIEKEVIYKKWKQSLLDRPENSYSLFYCNLSKDLTIESMTGALLKEHFSILKTVTFDERVKEYAEYFVYEDDRQLFIDTLNVKRLIANYYLTQRSERLEFREIVAPNTMRWRSRTTELVEYPNSTDIIAYVLTEDIDAKKQEEIRIKLRAETDALTGLFNRKTFTDTVTPLIKKRTVGTLDAVFMIDLDGFKQVNDTYGHATGDVVLVEVANRLRMLFRRYDILCRLGGDEFIIWLSAVPSRTLIKRKADEICANLCRLQNSDAKISASIGIAINPDDGADFETLYRKADSALYHVKSIGKNGYSFYESSFSEKL